MASIAGSAMTQLVRGAIYDASGVWGVVTDPAARRKGYSPARVFLTNREGWRGDETMVKK